MSKRSAQLARRQKVKVVAVDAPPATLRFPVMSREIAIVAVLGLIASGYLMYSSLFSNQLYCAGLGDCESVNVSVYAKLFGIPISVFGFASYVAIEALSLARLRLRGDWEFLSLLGVLSLAVSGTIYSAFLTYTELFILHAVCVWCVTSAVVMLAVLALTVVAVRREA